MLPLSDGRDNPTPWMLYAILAACVAGFGLQLTSPRELVDVYGNFPYTLDTNLRRWGFTAITASFLHAGFLHIGGNLLFLFVFGRSVEGVLGKFSFLVSYALFALAGFAGQWVVNPASHIPVIGASAAISGVMGFYLVYFPGQRVKTLILLGYFTRVWEIPAWALLGYWMGLQLFELFLAKGHGVAYGAHVGGFLMGLFFGFVWKVSPKANV